MEASLINCFIKAAVGVVSQEIQVDVSRDDLSVESNEFTTDELNILICIVGELEGQAFFCCSKKTAQQFVSVMADETIEQFSDMVSDGIAELANVIIGRATVYLEENGYSLDLSPPTLIIGEGVKIGTVSIKTVNVSLKTNKGNFSLKVGIQPPKP